MKSKKSTSNKQNNKKAPSPEDLIREGLQPGAEDTVKKKFFDYFKKNEASITFGQQIEKIYDLLSSGKLSKTDKAIIIGALLYFINPADVIPDIVPVLGFLDDLSIITLTYRYLSNRSLE